MAPGTPEPVIDPLTQVVLDRHVDPMVVLTAEGDLLHANPAFAALEAGHGRSLAAGLRYSDPADQQRLSAAVRRAGQGHHQEISVELTPASGAARKFTLTLQPTSTLTATLIVGHLHPDVDGDRTRAVRVHDMRLRSLFEGTGVAVAIADFDGRIVEANRACLDKLGYSHDEFLELDVVSITHPDDREALRAQLGALLSGSVPHFTMVKRYQSRTGSVVWGRTTVSTIRDEAGRPTNLAAIVEDISDVREAQQQLERSEGLQHLAGVLARVGGWALEGPERTLYWSRSMYGILDVPPGKEVEFTETISLYPREYRDVVQAAVDDCFANGTPFDLELEIHTHTGRRIPVRAIGRAQRDHDGQVESVMGAFQDISDLRAAADRAETAARRLETSLESMSDALFTVDRQWRFVFLNQRAAELLQRSRDDLIGKVVWDEFPEAVDSEVFHAYRRAMDEGTTQVVDEYFYPPLDTWFAVNAYPSDAGLAVYFRDITATREARRALEARDVQTRWQAALLDHAQDAILVRTLDHQITFWNRAAERIYGWSTDDAIGSSIRELLYDDPAEFDHATQTVLDTGEWTGRLTQRSAAVEQVIAACRWSLLRDEDGNPDAVLAINTDITQWHGIEQQLLRAQRMESIGTLAGGVAHDLNNALSPILMASDLLRAHATDPEVCELVDLIEAGARRSTDLVTQVLYFARGVDGQRLPVDVPGLLDDIATMVRETFPKNIDLTVNLSGHAPSVVGDSTQLQQVLLNLAVNARDAMPDGGRLSIRVFQDRLDARHLAAEAALSPGDYLVIEVEDTGTGMTSEVSDRIFEPFFTTKPQGAGTGLGLSTTLAIVESHGGFIRVYSDPGRGTRFRVHLPLGAAGEPIDVEQPLPGPLPQGRGETVLVVDDEAAIRATTCRTLEANGYQCLMAENGAEAVSVFTQHRDRIAAVIVDMMMPVMDGPATIHALQSMAPDLTMIGISGFHDDNKATLAAVAGVREFLPKPFTARALLDTLSGVLRTDAH